MFTLHDINLKLKKQASIMANIPDLLRITVLVDHKIIMETLNRIGVPNKRERILYPSCYLYKIDEDYYLVHFKQMFGLTREKYYNNISRDDILRRNAIAFCLRSWHLIEVEEEKIAERDKFVFVLPHHEKNDWLIEHKFNINSVYNQAGEYARH